MFIEFLLGKEHSMLVNLDNISTIEYDSINKEMVIVGNKLNAMRIDMNWSYFCKIKESIKESLQREISVLELNLIPCFEELGKIKEKSYQEYMRKIMLD